ncbi:hypothetical protein J6590_105458, partial [Homalodisca vitripennis]
VPSSKQGLYIFSSSCGHVRATTLIKHFRWNNIGARRLTAPYLSDGPGKLRVNEEGNLPRVD